jgi:hypothetical protein
METNQQKENNNEESSQVSGFSSMKSDYTRAVHETDQTLAQVALEAEKRKRRAEYGAQDSVVRVEQKRPSVLYSIAAVGLLAAAVLLIGYKLLLGPTEAPDPFAQFAVKTDILPNEQIGVSVSEFRRGLEVVLVELATQTPVEPNKVVHIYFTDEEVRPLRSISEENPVAVSNIGSLLSLISSDVPAPLIRSLNPSTYMYGVYGLADGSPSQFLLLKTDSFENTFAGMLAWEDTMAADLGDLLQIPLVENTTASDRLFFNKDARVIETSRGEVVLFYSFVNTNTVIITKDDRVFRDLLTRFHQSPIL